MRKTLLLTLVFVLGATMAFAQAGSVGLFADTAGDDCNLLDTTSGLTSYYCVHVGAPGATGCQFRAEKPACFTATYLSDGQVYPVTVGNSQAGVAVGYGSCLASPVHALTIQFFTAGTTAPCCYYPITEDPNVPEGTVLMVDCDENLLSAGAGTAIINSDASCNCNVATQETTWGQIKAIFD